MELLPSFCCCLSAYVVFYAKVVKCLCEHLKYVILQISETHARPVNALTCLYRSGQIVTDVQAIISAPVSQYPSLVHHCPCFCPLEMPHYTFAQGCTVARCVGSSSVTPISGVRPKESGRTVVVHPEEQQQVSTQWSQFYFQRTCAGELPGGWCSSFQNLYKCLKCL